jgi:hypothetical protein
VPVAVVAVIGLLAPLAVRLLGLPAIRRTSAAFAVVRDRGRHGPAGVDLVRSPLLIAVMLSVTGLGILLPVF